MGIILFLLSKEHMHILHIFHSQGLKVCLRKLVIKQIGLLIYIYVCSLLMLFHWISVSKLNSLHRP